MDANFNVNYNRDMILQVEVKLLETLLICAQAATNFIVIVF